MSGDVGGCRVYSNWKMEMMEMEMGIGIEIER